MEIKLPGSVFQDYQNRINSGSMTALEAQAAIASLANQWGGFKMTPDQEKWLDNMIAQQNTQSAREWERENAQNSTLWLANQLNSLGLSPSNVTGMGINHTNGVAAADNVKENMAENRAERQYGLAKSLISMAGSMSSAGIHGAALGVVKGSAASVAATASKAIHSASAYFRYR